MLKEFKEFATQGNAIDIATGVIIAGAFGKVVTSLVQDIFMPVIGFLLSGIDLKNLKIVLSKATVDAAGQDVAEVAITYGNLLQVTIDFILITLMVFLLVKAMNKMRRKKEEPIEETPAEPTEAELLGEIRDLLKSNHSKNGELR